MRRKVAAAVGLGLAASIIYPLFYKYMVGPSVPGPLQGMFMVTFGLWMVWMMASLLRSITRPGDDTRKDSRRT